MERVLSWNLNYLDDLEKNRSSFQHMRWIQFLRRDVYWAFKCSKHSGLHSSKFSRHCNDVLALLPPFHRAGDWSLLRWTKLPQITGLTCDPAIDYAAQSSWVKELRVLSFSQLCCLCIGCCPSLCLYSCPSVPLLCALCPCPLLIESKNTFSASFSS